MNKHTRLAFIIAPFLAVLGWIASDLWIERTQPVNQFFTLTAENDYCDVIAKQCVLRSGDIKLSLYTTTDGENKDRTVINSTYPLDSATLFLVDNQGNATPFRMALLQTPYYWYEHTPFALNNATKGSKQVFRLIATIKGNQYAGEFTSTTQSTLVSAKVD